MQGQMSIPDLHAHYFFVYCQKESVLNRPEDMEEDNAFQTGEIDTETSGRLRTEGDISREQGEKC